MQSKRIFLALDLSDAARAVSAAHISFLRQAFPSVRVGWERAEKLHVTLKFLGPTESQTLAELKRSLSALGAQHAPFKLRLSQPGVFPSKARPRILWIGVDDPSAAVAPLFTSVENVCHELGFGKEGRDFRPHITIGRIRERPDSVELAALHIETKIEPVEFDVADLVIYESKLQPTGSIYSVISKARLGQQR